MREEKAGVGIFSEALSWSFSLRLPDYTPIFEAELLAILLALRKLSANESSAVIVTDSKSVCSALTSASPSESSSLNVFMSLIPKNFSTVRLVWVPGHRGIFLNEMADVLARWSLDGPAMYIVPDTDFITASRFRKYALHQDSMKARLPQQEYGHLSFPWNNKWCPSRKLEVSLTKLRCRIPPLNFYLHRAGLVPSPLCFLCQEPENIDHFLIHCRRFSSHRKKHFEYLFRNLNIPLDSANILSLGASSLGHSNRNVCIAVCEFLRDTRRVPY